MSPPKPPRKTPPLGHPAIESDEDRALAELQRRRSRQEQPTPPPASEFESEFDESTNPVILIDPERWKTDERYRRDWEAALREFNTNAAYRILWERSGRSRRQSDQAAAVSANAALATHADAGKVETFAEELRRLDGELRDHKLVLKITKWILGFVIAATLGSVGVVFTKIFNWGMSTQEMEDRIHLLENQIKTLEQKEHRQ